jgi:hypothetical protein
MAYIKDKQQELTTVEEMIDALSKFPKDMQLQPAMQIYRLDPVEGECFDDPRGCVCVEDDDSF